MLSLPPILYKILKETSILFYLIIIVIPDQNRKISKYRKRQRIEKAFINLLSQTILQYYLSQSPFLCTLEIIITL